MAEVRKIDLTCPSCGAEMQISKDQKMAVCPYCRKKIYFSMENGKLTAKEAEERSYGETRGRLRAEAEAEEKQENRRDLRKLRKRVINIGSAAVIIGGCVFANQVRKAKLDPFPYVSVSFSGKDGEGQATLQQGSFPEKINGNRISYSVEPKEKLSNGDTVTVQAKSDEYRLNKKIQKYTVTGLESYLSSLDSLDSAALQPLHEISLTAIRQNYFPTSMSGTHRNEELSAKPVKLILLSKDKTNVLSDIFEISYHGQSGKTHTVYQVARYKNVLVREGDSVSFDYDNVITPGQSIYLGDNVMNDDMSTGYNSLAEAEAEAKKTDEGGMTVTEREE